MPAWNYGKPPNEEFVEVEHPDGKIIEVQAFYGRDGYRPHWQGRDGVSWSVDAFQKWRPLTKVQLQDIEALVCEDILKRQALGITKYGKTVAETPLSLLEWLEHAYQECLDQAVYLKRAMQEIK